MRDFLVNFVLAALIGAIIGGLFILATDYSIPAQMDIDARILEHHLAAGG